MCQRATCSSCGKSTFVGCGRHVEAVPVEARCQCRAGASNEKPAAARQGLDRVAALFGGARRAP